MHYRGELQSMTPCALKAKAMIACLQHPHFAISSAAKKTGEKYRDIERQLSLQYLKATKSNKRKA
jgi:hypothetical protein